MVELESVLREHTWHHYVCLHVLNGGEVSRKKGFNKIIQWYFFMTFGHMPNGGISRHRYASDNEYYFEL